MYHSFERIVADSMMENDYIPGYDDGEWIDTDDTFPEDMQGEEEFA